MDCFTVYPAVYHLIKAVKFPVEDPPVFKKPMDKQLETFFKTLFFLAGPVLHITIAVILVFQILV